MNQPFHSGELELQRRAGALDQGAAVGGIIRNRMTQGVANFLLQQRLAVAATLEADGRVWASLLSGEPGFLRAADEERVLIDVHPLSGEPLHDTLSARSDLGLLVIDPTTRQRFRINGRGRLAPRGIVLEVEQAYGNCPKYIQRRALAAGGDGDAEPRPARLTRALSPRQQDWVRPADTLFVATFHQDGGADASHRGGQPGFIRVHGTNRLSFADYPGNSMYSTLGNLLHHPQAGLLFVDFTSGDVLQLAGRASVGPDFSVTFEVEAVRETRRATSLRYTLVEYSPANPPLSQSTDARHLTVTRRTS